MIHNEHLRSANEQYEIRHDHKGNAIHVYIRDNDAVIYGTLDDLIQSVYFGKQVERIYCFNDDLETIYENESYEFKKLKDIYDFGILNAFRVINNEESDSGDKLQAWSYIIKKGFGFKINDYCTMVVNDYLNTGVIDENGDIL